MRKYLMAAAVAAASVSAPAMAAHVITLGSTPPAGLTVFNDFEATPAGTALGTNASVFSAPAANVSARPVGSTGNYATVLNGGSATFTLPSASAAFGFLIGSLDSYNSLRLDFSDGSFEVFNGGAITNGLGAEGYVTYDYSQAGKLITSATFTSSGNSMEFDNLAATAVPEPATWALLILGFGLVGGAMRRRTSVKLAFA